MPPAAVIRNVEIGIAAQSDADDAADGFIEPRANQPKMRCLAAFRRGEDDRTTVTHRRRAQERRGFRR
jgi:hypothetical protein